jgi:hypothetical protein
MFILVFIHIYWVKYILYTIINPYIVKYVNTVWIHIGLQFIWSYSQLMEHKEIFLDENNVKNCSNRKMKKHISDKVVKSTTKRKK